MLFVLNKNPQYADFYFGNFMIEYKGYGKK